MFGEDFNKSEAGNLMIFSEFKAELHLGFPFHFS